MKRHYYLVLAAGATMLAACQGLSDAFSAHVDVVAKAGSQELSVVRLGDLLGKAKLGIPVNQEIATAVARDLWVPYQLLALAAAKGDSLGDPKGIDAAAATMFENARIQKFMENLSKTFPTEGGSQADYESGKGDMYSARHILFMMPPNANLVVRDSVKKLAESVRAQVTDANFADMAKKYSADATSKNGGDLGLFPKNMMVKQFSNALAKLKPGEISPLVQTQFGFHIIQRNTWDHVKGDYGTQFGNRGKQVAESTYVAGIQSAANVQLKSDAATSAKEMAKDPLGHRADDRVLATFNGGSLTVGKLAMVLLANPSAARLTQQIVAAPDSLVNQYVTNMAQREVLLQRADSAKSAVSPEEMNQLHADFKQAVVAAWNGLNVDPKSLADSAATPDARARLAAARVEAYIDRVMAGQAQPLPVAAPLQIVLLGKFDAKVNPAGIDRAVERAQQLRLAADSSRAAAQPRSEVPLPGAMTPPAGSAVPAPAAPAAKKP